MELTATQSLEWGAAAYSGWTHLLIWDGDVCVWAAGPYTSTTEIEDVEAHLSDVVNSTDVVEARELAASLQGSGLWQRGLWQVGTNPNGDLVVSVLAHGPAVL